MERQARAEAVALVGVATEHQAAALVVAARQARLAMVMPTAALGPSVQATEEYPWRPREASGAHYQAKRAFH